MAQPGKSLSDAASGNIFDLVATKALLILEGKLGTGWDIDVYFDGIEVCRKLRERPAS